MFCHQCGNNLEEGVKFCPNCGTPVIMPVAENVVSETTATVEPPTSSFEEPQEWEQPAEPVYQPEEPVYQQPQAPVVNEEANRLAKQCLIFGIIGLSFTCTAWLSLFGIIFSAIGRGKVKVYLATGEALKGKARVGAILSKIGLIFGIILFVFVVIYLCVITFSVIRDIDINRYLQNF